MSSDLPTAERPSAPPTAEALRATFDAPEPLTLGLEEELMLLDPATLELAPAGSAVLAELGGDPRFKLELPASQLEIVTQPASDVPSAIAQLADGRRTLLERAGDIALPAAAGVHPFSPAEGELNDAPRYRQTVEQFGAIAHRQLVCALQVHVAVGGADRTLAVYNALRSYLPDLAALAAAAPYYEGRDTGLASIRPKIGEQLTRQGMAPIIDSWEDFADALRWGAATGLVAQHADWWWELRPHPAWGTLELRVPDSQASVADAAAIAAVAHALIAWLAGRHDAGQPLPRHPTWRLEENRWLACRDGVEGSLADLDSGQLQPTRQRLRRLFDRLEPEAERLGGAEHLEHARELAEKNGAMRQREVGEKEGPRAVAAWLAERFRDGLESSDSR
jgi:glutamate---cysteine ligase / carboxylate-amine ligase